MKGNEVFYIFLGIIYGIIGSVVSVKIDYAPSILQHIKRSLLWPYYVFKIKK